MNLQPLGDRLIVEVLEEEQTTVSGIVLPDTAKEKPQRGRVVAAGPGGRNEAGERVPLAKNGLNIERKNIQEGRRKADGTKNRQFRLRQSLGSDLQTSFFDVPRSVLRPRFQCDTRSPLARG